jgi:hypothetical protein
MDKMAVTAVLLAVYYHLLLQAVAEEEEILPQVRMLD